MALCPTCGKELNEKESSAKFCTYCGAPLAHEEPKTTENAPVAEEPTPAVEEPAPEAAPAEQSEKKPIVSVNVDEIKDSLNDAKDKALPFIDKIFEKLKTVPALNKLLEKVDKSLYPLLLAVPVAFLAFVIVLVVIISSSGSYMTPMKDYIKLVNKKSTDYVKLETALEPDFRAKASKALYDVEAMEDQIEDYTDDLEDMYEAIDDEFDKWKIGFKAKEKEKLSKKKLKDLQEALDEYYDSYIESYVDQLEDTLDDDDALEEFADEVDMSEKEAKAYIKSMIKYYETYEDVKITAGYEVKGRFTIKADKEKWESDTVRVLFIKINGDWAYAGLDDDGYINFDDDDEEIYLFSDFFYQLRKNHLE